MKVVILLTDRCAGSLAVSLVDALITANYCHIKSGAERPLFEWVLTSLDGQPVMPFNGLPLTPDCAIDDVYRDDSIPVDEQIWVVPSIYDALSRQHKIADAIERLAPMADLVRHHYQRGGLLASCCTGSFLLASAGVIDHYPALMHWRSELNFNRLFPHLKTDTRSPLVDYGRIVCTTGGAHSCHQLVIHLVEKFHSDTLALAVAKMLQVDRYPTPPVVYGVTEIDPTHNDDKVRIVQARFRENLHTSIHIEQLADDLNISERQLVRRFRQATGLSPLKYLQKERLKRACQLLENSRLTSARIALEVGYQDESNFRRLFKRELGMTMEHYRNQFGGVRQDTQALERVPT